MEVWKNIVQSKIINISQRNNTNNGTVLGVIPNQNFNFNKARLEFDSQWENLISIMKNDEIYQGNNCYICCGRIYFFSEHNSRYSKNQEISIIVDGYEDVSNNDFNKVTFSVKCNLDIKTGIITYYKRDKSILKQVSIGSETYKEIIETLMNEAIK